MGGMDNDLLSEIREFLSQTGMGPSYFGKAACGNSEVVRRLAGGKTVTLATAAKLRAFMASRRVVKKARPGFDEISASISKEDA